MQIIFVKSESEFRGSFAWFIGLRRYKAVVPSRSSLEFYRMIDHNRFCLVIKDTGLRLQSVLALGENTVCTE
jgi:hypothetical protein